MTPYIYIRIFWQYYGVYLILHTFHSYFFKNTVSAESSEPPSFMVFTTCFKNNFKYLFKMVREQVRTFFKTKASCIQQKNLPNQTLYGKIMGHQIL